MNLPRPLHRVNRYSLLQLCLSTLFAIVSSAPLAQTSRNGFNIGPESSAPPESSRADHRSPTGGGPLEQQQQRFMELEKQLQLSDKQRPLWDRYRQRIDALNADLMRNPQGSVTARDNALQQMGRKIDLARNRLAALEDIGEAATALYRTLNSDQQTVADKLLAVTLPDLYGAPLEVRSSEPERGNSRSGGNGGPPGMGGGPGGMMR